MSTTMVGVVDNTPQHKLSVVDYDADKELMSHIKHVLRPKEKFLQFVSRTGLAKSQILAMSKNEISRFVEQAEVNSVNDPTPPAELFEQKSPPAKFTIALDTFQ